MEARQDRRTYKIVIAVACVFAFAMAAPLFAFPPMEHIVAEEFLLSHAQASFVFATPLIMIAVLAIPGGILVDKIGIKKAGGISAILMAAGAVLRYFSPNFPLLITFTAIYGAGHGLGMPILPKLVSSMVPKEKAGIATGAYSAALCAGTALPVAITLPLIPITGSFQAALAVWGIPAVIAVILWWTLIRDPVGTDSQSVPVSEGDTPLRQLAKSRVVWLLTIFFLLDILFSFGWHEWAPGLMMLKGASPNIAAIMASVTLWVEIPVSLFVPGLSDKLGLRRPFLYGTTIIWACAAVAAIYSNVPMSWPIMILIGGGDAALFAMTMVMIVEVVPDTMVGTASGLVLAAGHLGGFFGPWIGGHFLDVYGNFNVFLLFLTGVAIAKTFIAFRLPETGTRAGIKRFKA